MVSLLTAAIKTLQGKELLLSSEQVIINSVFLTLDAIRRTFSFWGQDSLAKSLPVLQSCSQTHSEIS